MGRTPAPWEARRATDAEPGFGWWLYAPSYGAVGYWRGGKQNDKNRYWQLSEADAHLMAAAPTMLEALDLAIGSIKCDRQDDVNNEVFRRIARALAKARGETL